MSKIFLVIAIVLFLKALINSSDVENTGWRFFALSGLLSTLLAAIFYI